MPGSAVSRATAKPGTILSIVKDKPLRCIPQAIFSEAALFLRISGRGIEFQPGQLPGFAISQVSYTGC